MMGHPRVLLLAMSWLFALLLLPGACLADCRTVAELEGRVSAHSFSDSIVESNDPWSQRTQLSIDSDGVITAGLEIDYDGSTEAIAGGNVSVSCGGSVSVSVERLDATVDLHEGLTMDADGSVLAGVEEQGGNRSIALVLTRNGSFANTDLGGTWYVYDLWDDSVENDPGWASGWFNVESNGAITGGAVEFSMGATDTITGGSMAVDSDGIVSGSFSLLSGGHVPFVDLEMDSGKTVCVGMRSINPTNPSLTVMIKGDGSFLPADLEGEWHAYGYVDASHPQASAPACSQSSIVLDASGAVVGGTASSCDGGQSYPLVAGNYSIDADGFVTGSHSSTSTTSESLSNLKMDAGKTVIIGINRDDGDGDLGLAIFVPEPNGIVLQLTGIGFLLMLSHRRRGRGSDRENKALICLGADDSLPCQARTEEDRPVQVR